MKTKMILFIVLILPFNYGQAQEENFRKFGIGVGYHTSSIVGDSVKPFEVSLRYRIDNKHTLQVYAPLWLKRDKLLRSDPKPDYMKQEHYDIDNFTWKHQLWGVGIGYDYAFYSYSALDFFAGLSADFQWYEYREDRHYVNYNLIEGITRPPVFEDFYISEHQAYYWNRKKGISLIPNLGVRFVTPKLTVEGKLNLYASQFNKKVYYFNEVIYPYTSSTWQSFYPMDYRNELSIRPEISFNFSYYF